MSKIKAFIYIYTKSLTSLGYYKTIPGSKSSISVKYFVILATLATAIATLRLAVPLIPEAKQGAEDLINQTGQLYPDDLVLEAKDGAWTINQPEPYSIKMPEALKNSMQEHEEELDTKDTDKLISLIVFDHEGTIKDIQEGQTLILVNDANVLTRNQSTIEAHPLTNLPDGKFTKQEFNDFMGRISQFSKYIPVAIFILLAFASAMYYFLFRMLYLVSLSALLFIMGSIKGLRLPFGTYYRIGIHTLTLPLTIEIISVLVEKPITISYWFFVLNFVFGILAVNQISKPESSNITSAPAQTL